MHLKLDADVQKSEAEKLRIEKWKIEEDRDSLKTEYKRMRLTIKNVGLGKTPEQWRREIQEEKAKANYWENKFQEMQARNEALEKSLAESQSEKSGLKARVDELGRSLHHYRSCNFEIELKSSLNKIKEMEGRIEELESALHSCELRIELLETREGRWKEELHHSHDQIRNRDYLMGDAIVQIQEVADHLQTLAAEADILSMKYEIQLGRSEELISLLGKIKTLGLRAKAYL
ncbi:tropomyosin-1-like [Gossypium australe]|uniref:Tropomyosin-1-like n=1 Tax=Gossypium australe TaxID=47621 RepID=A0A5B6VC56_9ROSI|nr:tropomyosin-1-like [Gossypium australe]